MRAYYLEIREYLQDIASYVAEQIEILDTLLETRFPTTGERSDTTEVKKGKNVPRGEKLPIENNLMASVVQLVESRPDEEVTPTDVVREFIKGAVLDDSELTAAKRRYQNALYNASRPGRRMIEKVKGKNAFRAIRKEGQ